MILLLSPFLNENTQILSQLRRGAHFLEVKLHSSHAVVGNGRQFDKRTGDLDILKALSVTCSRTGENQYIGISCGTYLRGQVSTPSCTAGTGCQVPPCFPSSSPSGSTRSPSHDGSLQEQRSPFRLEPKKGPEHIAMGRFPEHIAMWSK